MLTVRVHGEQRARWSEAAQRDGRTLSSWVRKRLDEAAEAECRKSKTTTFECGAFCEEL